MPKIVTVALGNKAYITNYLQMLCVFLFFLKFLYLINVHRHQCLNTIYKSFLNEIIFRKCKFLS